jgi:hypothetical protein
VRTRKQYLAAILEIEDWMQYKVTLNEEGAVHDTLHTFSYYFFHKYEQNFTDLLHLTRNSIRRNHGSHGFYNAQRGRGVTGRLFYCMNRGIKLSVIKGRPDASLVHSISERFLAFPLVYRLS